MSIKLAIEEWGIYNSVGVVCKWWEPGVDDIEEVVEFYSAIRKEHDIEPYTDLELFIADSENGIQFSEHENVHDVWPLIEEYNNLDDNEQLQVLVALDAGWASDLKEALEVYDDVASTGASNREELADEYISSCYGRELTDAWFYGYLDLDAIGRDMMFEGQYHEYGDEIYQFCR